MLCGLSTAEWQLWAEFPSCLNTDLGRQTGSPWPWSLRAWPSQGVQVPLLSTSGAVICPNQN